MTARSSTREYKIRAGRSRTSFSAAAACHGGRNLEGMKTNNCLVRKESIFLFCASSTHQRICILKVGQIKNQGGTRIEEWRRGLRIQMLYPSLGFYDSTA